MPEHELTPEDMQFLDAYTRAHAVRTVGERVALSERTYFVFRHVFRHWQPQTVEDVAGIALMIDLTGQVTQWCIDNPEKVLQGVKHGFYLCWTN